MKPGDHVYIGKPGPNKVHWEVVSSANGWLTLQSPMSGRRAIVRPENVTPHEGARA
jgi:hypothetical protein